MDCRQCGTPNPEENQFCGHCGTQLRGEINASESSDWAELDRRIDWALDAKLSAHPNIQTIEVKATEEVVDRAWKWLTRFAKIVGIPFGIIATAVTVIVGILGYVGLDSITSIQDLSQTAQTNLKEAEKQTTALKPKIKAATELADRQVKNIEAFQAKLARLEDMADQHINDIEASQAKLARLDEFSQRIPELEKQFRKIDSVKEEITGVDTLLRARDKLREGTGEKNPDKKIELLTDAIRLDPNLEAAYFNRALTYNDQGKLQLALSDYDKVIGLNPRGDGAYNNRGLVYLGLKELDKAIADFDQAISITPKSAFAYSNRGLAYARKKQNDKAIENYQKSIELNPNARQAYKNWADLLKDEGGFAGAIEILSRAIDRIPENANLYNDRGIAYWLNGDVQRSLADYVKAIELKPSLSFPYRNRGHVYFNSGKYAAAEQDFAQTLRLKPTHAFALIWRFLSGDKAGGPNPEALRQGFESIDKASWPAPVISMYLNDITIAELREAAKDDDATTQNNQSCEAEFYIGTKLLLEDKQVDAVGPLKHAAKTCPKTYVEYAAAKAELERLGAR